MGGKLHTIYKLRPWKQQHTTHRAVMQEDSRQINTMQWLPY